MGKIAERESHPLAVLRHDQIASGMLYIGFYLFSLSLLAVVSCFYTGILNLFPAIIGISLILMSFALSLIFANFFLLMAALLTRVSAHREARLCFKLASEKLRKLAEGDMNTKQKTTLKDITWLKKGFHRFNKFLLKTYHQEIIDVDSYYWQVYNDALLGTSREIDEAANHITQLLESSGRSTKECNIKEFLITLQHIKGKKGKEAELTSQLNKMIKPLSFSERIKPIITSPYLKFILTAIATVSIFIEVIQRF